MDAIIREIECIGNFGDYKREELTVEYGQPKFDMMHAIIDGLRALPLPSSPAPGLDRETIRNAGYEYDEDDDSVRIRIDAILALQPAPNGETPKHSDVREDARRLDFFHNNNNCELSCVGGWNDDDMYWAVHRVNGGRNDREWTLIGSGKTPREAIDAALTATKETDGGNR